MQRLQIFGHTGYYATAPDLKPQQWMLDHAEDDQCFFKLLIDNNHVYFSTLNTSTLSLFMNQLKPEERKNFEISIKAVKDLFLSATKIDKDLAK